MAGVRQRRTITGLILIAIAIGVVVFHPDNYTYQPSQPDQTTVDAHSSDDTSVMEAAAVLETLPVKGRAAKTGYARSMFGNGWSSNGICDTRNQILYRDLVDPVVDDECKVIRGQLHDPYTGRTLDFVRGPQTSQLVQIDHVVALSDAWQKGAQNLSYDERVALANDPLELLAVDGQTNNDKGAGDAATWLPPNKLFRCQYVARQIAVKQKYSLWVTSAERDAMRRVLSACPGQAVPRPIYD